MASSGIERVEWKTGDELIVDTSPVVESADEPVPPAAGLIKNELKTLARQSSHYLAGLIANLSLGFVSFPIFTRVLSVSEYGLMDLGQRLLLMLTIASKLGFQNASLRFYNRQEFEKDAASERNYYSTLFFGMLTTSLTVGLLFLVVARVLPNALALSSLSNLIYPILGLALIRAMGSILWGFLRIEERTKTFNLLQVATKATTLAMVFSLLPWTGPYARAYFVGALAVETVLVVSLTGWLLLRRVLDLRYFNFSFFRAALAFGAPLVLYEFAFAVLGSADRFLVRHYVGANALGLYSVAYGLAGNVNEFLVAPLTLALVPIYMRLWTSDGQEKTSAFLAIAFDLFLMAALGILAAVTAAGHSALVLLASAKYSGADHLIPVILGGLLIWTANVFVGAGLLIHKQTVKMSTLLVSAAVANILLNCLLLPRMGLMGGAIATLLSYLICIVLLGIASHRILPFQIDIRSCGKYVLAAVLACTAGSLFTTEPAALNFLVKSAVVFTVYLLTLCILHSPVWSAVRWSAAWLRQQCF